MGFRNPDCARFALLDVEDLLQAFRDRPNVGGRAKVVRAEPPGQDVDNEPVVDVLDDAVDRI